MSHRNPCLVVIKTMASSAAFPPLVPIQHGRAGKHRRWHAKVIMWHQERQFHRVNIKVGL